MQRADAVDRFLTCPVCLEVYSSPRMLNCDHAFCCACLERLPRYTTPQHTFLLCPLCKAGSALTSRGVRGLRKCFWIEQMKDVLEEALKVKERGRGEEVGVVECGGCRGEVGGGERGWHYCWECAASLCSVCLGKHSLTTFTAAHKVIDLSEGGALREFVLCGVHQGRGVTCVCCTCAVPLCPLCLLDHDKGHVLDDVTEVIDDFRSTQEGLRTMKERTEHLRRHLEEIKGTSQEEDTEKQKEALERVSDKVEQILNFLRNTFSVEIDAIRKDMEHCPGGLVGQKLLQLDSLQSKIQKAVTSSPVGVMLRQRKDSEVSPKRDRLSGSFIDHQRAGECSGDVTQDLLSYRL